ncbi:erythropoietin isoform X2 [Salmo trutta]|uniref:erythropoietin isoform X2 n=1 Tax=Salmo trutta TaxID=8032 RepID=UPI001132988C|nr:erythropoietin-like isoform X2 [Salmo trutta]
MSSISGPVVVLLTVLQWAGRGLPSPVRPICDPRILDRFIMEARDTETALRGCKAGCGVTGTFVVPLTNVDFVVWETKDVSTCLSDLPLPPAPAVGDSVTRKVSSLSELLHVHTNFLRGKGRLLLTNAPACQQNST